MASPYDQFLPLIGAGSTAPQTTAPQQQSWSPSAGSISGGQDFVGLQQRQMELDAIIAAAQAQYDRLREAGVNERFAKEQALQWAQFEWQKQYQKEQMGLDLTKTLAQFKGPRDWLVYSNIMNSQRGTNLPGYAQQALSNSLVPGFKGIDWNAMFNNSYAPVWNAINQAQSPTGAAGGSGAGQATPAAGGGTVTSFTAPNINPQSVSQRAWNSMLPSQQQMLYGQLEQQGLDPADWAQMMQNSWNTRKVTPVTRFG